LNWKQTPKSVKDFNDNFLLARGQKGNGVLFFLFGVVPWSLWLNRNDRVFRNRLISSSHSVVYKLFFIMQHSFERREERDELGKLIEGVRACLPEEVKAVDIG
jgi:hypothetical protein